MAAGPQGPTGQGPHDDPTMPVHPAAAPPAYAPPPDQRFDRGPQPGGPPPQQQYPPPGYGAYAPQPDQGPSRDYAAEAAQFARRHLRTPETKEFFKTSEFGVWALTCILLGIAAATSDAFDGGRMWLYLTIASAAYILSRGIAKAGSSRGKPESHWGHDHQ